MLQSIVKSLFYRELHIFLLVNITITVAFSSQFEIKIQDTDRLPTTLHKQILESNLLCNEI